MKSGRLCEGGQVGIPGAAGHRTDQGTSLGILFGPVSDMTVYELTAEQSNFGGHVVIALAGV